jgi:hypothetical protein
MSRRGKKNRRKNLGRIFREKDMWGTGKCLLMAIMLQSVVAPNSGERNNVLEQKDREIAVLRRRIIELEAQLYRTSEQHTSAQEGKLNHDSMSTNR